MYNRTPITIPKDCIGVYMRDKRTLDTVFFLYPDTPESRYYFEGFYIKGESAI